MERPQLRVRLAANAVAVPALASAVRPALVLAEREALTLLRVAGERDVERGGRFSAGPACVQVWSGPFDGEGHLPGAAVHLGSVDWCYDTPNRHWVTIYRAMVTEAGRERGETPETVLAQVLGLAGLSVERERVALARPPARDPFRRNSPLLVS